VKRETGPAAKIDYLLRFRQCLFAVICFVTNAITKSISSWRRWQRRGREKSCVSLPPKKQQNKDAYDAEEEEGERYDPGDVIKASANRGCEDGGAVFVGEGFEYGVVSGVGVYLAMQFCDKAGGFRTSDVVAFEEDLRAAAGTHELVTELVEARGGGACSDHGERQCSEKDELEESLRHWVPQERLLPTSPNRDVGRPN